MTTYYVDAKGMYIGGFDGANPPAGAIEVPTAPDNALMQWDGSKWIVPAINKDAIVDSERIGAYNDEGCTIQDLTVALWKRIMEGNNAPSDAIEITRKKIQAEFPK